VGTFVVNAEVRAQESFHGDHSAVDVLVLRVTLTAADLRVAFGEFLTKKWK
jgi:hypothetical protein